MNISDVFSPSPSVAVTLTDTLPRSEPSALGVPLKIPVSESNVNQWGRSLPFTRLAERVKTSPTSGSAKVKGSNAVCHSSPSTATWLGIPVVRMGASLTLLTSREKLLDDCTWSKSVAVTVTRRSPTSSRPGVPINTRVPGSNSSHPGRASPPSRVAERTISSPTSAS